MKHLNWSTWLLVFNIAMNGCISKTEMEGRKTEDFNYGWVFAKDLPNADYSRTGIDVAGFDSVTLPHTANIEPLTVNNQWMGTCWYRKTFTIPKSESNRLHSLYFEGAMQNANVYLNGKLLLQHTGGYLPFYVSLNSELKYGEPNLLAVKLINTDDSLVPPGKALNVLDFNRYGGIYRNVKLISTSKIHITDALNAKLPATGGVFIQFDGVDSTKALLKTKTQIINETDAEQSFRVEQRILNSDSASSDIRISESIKAKAFETIEINEEITINQPNLWSPSNPNLYHLETSIVQNSKVVDQISQKFGIRKVELTKDGLFLNGNKLFLTGTNRHQEYPYVGYALSDAAQWRDAVKIKNAGFDMVRLSHYPQSEAFMDACDALGIVTMNSIPGWQFNGNETFKQHVLQDVRDLIRRDRNRASVFFWEFSLNESWMEPEFMDRILAVKDQEFPDAKPLTCAWIDYPGYDLFIPARQHGKPPVYWNQYKEGNRPVFIAEYGDWEYYAQNAGFNQTAYSNLKEEERTSRQLRGSGEKRMLQQAMNFQESSNSNQKGISTIGQANWLMFDYNRGYANDIESSGIADIFRIPKFATYYYQSQRDANESVKPPAMGGPMVFIASYWLPDSDKKVTVYSNCDEVELKLNGKLIGMQKPDNSAFNSYLKHPPFTFHLNKFEVGTLEAIGYIGGLVKVSHSVSTPQNPVEIKIAVDETGIPMSTNQDDIFFVYASIVDQNGTVCPVNGQKVEFLVTGNSELIGENPATVEAGIATILIKTRKNFKEISILAKSEHLHEATYSLK
ncbi:MAG: glycoside hydrolase family 2 TIM barrel-domain containing protein [Salinivirgaceae bacterium]